MLQHGLQRGTREVGSAAVCKVGYPAEGAPQLASGIDKRKERLEGILHVQEGQECAAGVSEHDEC